jgi:hypothetical protein
VLERAKGIEPSYAAWEAAVLPLNYARKINHLARLAGPNVLQNVLHASGPASLPFLAALSAKRKPRGAPRPTPDLVYGVYHLGAYSQEIGFLYVIALSVLAMRVIRGV